MLFEKNHENLCGIFFYSGAIARTTICLDEKNGVAKKIGETKS